MDTTEIIQALENGACEEDLFEMFSGKFTRGQIAAVVIDYNSAMDYLYLPED